MTKSLPRHTINSRMGLRDAVFHSAFCAWYGYVWQHLNDMDLSPGRRTLCWPVAARMQVELV